MSEDVPAARVVVPVRVVGFTPGAALLVATAVFAAFVLRNAFVEAHRVIGWIVACGIVALLIDPVVDRLQRHLPRWLSVIVVVAAVRLGTTVPIVVALLAYELYGFGAAAYSVAIAVLGLAALDATSWARGEEAAD